MYDTIKPYKKQIFEIIKQTWETPYISIEEGIYPVFKKKIPYPEIIDSMFSDRKVIF